MTTGSAVSRLQDNSLLGLGANLVAVLVAGFLCHLAKFDQYETSGVIALAMGVPAAVELQIRSRRRDKNVDIARIERGELRRPVALVVMLLSAAIFLLDTAGGGIIEGIGWALGHLVDAGKIDESTAKFMAAGAFGVMPPVILGVCVFLVAFYASHYFAKRPYLWTATAVGCALAIRELVLLGLRSTGELNGLIQLAGSFTGVLVIAVIAYLGILFISFIGVWFGRRYHNEFLAKKLERMEAKAAKQATKQGQSTLQSQTTATQSSAQDSNAPPTSAPKLVTLVNAPKDLPAAPGDNQTSASEPKDLPSALGDHQTSDPLKQIETLARLRDSGALTEEEFQAKKTEILCRI
jgi:hypothetical protein